MELDTGVEYRLPASAVLLRAVAVAGVSALALSGPQLVGQAKAAVPASRKAQASVRVIQTTADLSEALTPLPSLHLENGRPRGVPVVTIDDNAKFQTVRGFGAAMTDSSAWLIREKLSPAKQSSLMRDLFSPLGIHLNVVRVPMGASDYSALRRPYTYDDLPRGQADPGLRHFSVRHDRAYIIPALQQVLTTNPGVEVFANPWTAPPWMKANAAYNNVAGDGLLLPQYYSSYAQYFVRFAQAYARAHIPITAFTPINEPGVRPNYPSMSLPSDAEGAFVAQDMRPALMAAGINVKIFGDDLGWDSGSYANSLAGGPFAHAFDGISWHCYAGSPAAMTRLHRIAPQMEQIENECAPSDTPYAVPEIVIGAMRNDATTAELWNIALDPNGQPVEPPNVGCGGCRGLVTVNPSNRTVTKSVGYFQLGQASKFVSRGATRIGSNQFVRYFANRRASMAAAAAPTVGATSGYGVTSGLEDVAFRNPNGSHVLVAYDHSDHPITFAVREGHQFFRCKIPAKATTTFLWR